VTENYLYIIDIVLFEYDSNQLITQMCNVYFTQMIFAKFELKFIVLKFEINMHVSLKFMKK